MQVAIIGAGFSGMCAAIKLREAGIAFRMFEKASDVGGTWLHNVYPGVACDVPSHSYTFSFEPNPHWSHAFAGGAEIEAYAQSVANKYGIRECCSFGTEVTRLEFDLAANEWIVHFVRQDKAQQQSMRFQVCFNCAGVLHVPKWPDAQGVGAFQGDAEVHTAEWHKLPNNEALRGKRVVVVGSAASATQVVPSICDQVQSLVVLQRTSNWIVATRSPLYPSKLTFSPAWLWALSHRWVLDLYRSALYWSLELVFLSGVFSANSRVHAYVRSSVERAMLKQLQGDKMLGSKVIPTYEIGCKRIIRSDQYLPACVFASSLSSRAFYGSPPVCADCANPTCVS